ncbi:MAG TPA: GWxTD domain-containing protein [Candidatus Aminicenantes bacterium]|nr:GWxTD domain-containing protein [Candidatus Aminicenantes bacterium]
MTTFTHVETARRAAAGLLALLVPALAVAAAAAGAACRTYGLERKLPPSRAEFLGQVGYIITKAERKIFLELPDADRDDFIEEFWKRRDPDPDTAVNEYRLEYEDRVRRAGAMFHGEGRAGWLTDRGRIYILFGPPSERQTYPMDAAGFCREVWYYGSFPVLFIDEHCQGNFALRAINLEHLQELNIAQGRFQKTFDQAKRFFDYEVSMLKTAASAGVFEGKVFVDIPYNTIWFNFKDGRLLTSFDVRLELSDESGAAVWRNEASFPLSLAEEELTRNRKGRFRMEFPLRIDKDPDRLIGRKLRLDVSVRSETEGEALKKAVEFRLKT